MKKHYELPVDYTKLHWSERKERANNPTIQRSQNPGGSWKERSEQEHEPMIVRP